MPAHSSESIDPPQRSGGTGEDRFARTAALYGAAGFSAIRRGRVTVVGLGGVGSHAAIALARGGIGELHLIDADAVSVSSLNRFIAAGPADVGQSKVGVLQAHLASTCPDTVVRISETFLNADNATHLLDPDPHVVVDAIDSLTEKIALLTHCVRQGVPAISSMGAAVRREVGAVRVADLAETHGCPLARRLRRELRAVGIVSGITCVYSLEAPRVASQRPLPSGISLPGIFGYALASGALDQLASAGTG